MGIVLQLVTAQDARRRVFLRELTAQGRGRLGVVLTARRFVGLFETAQVQRETLRTNEGR